MTRTARLAWIVGWLALGLEAAPAPAWGAEPLTVFAAADLVFAFQELVPLFEGTQGVKVTLVTGSTGNLARQIEHGAPADVFFAADPGFVDRLLARQVLLPETRTLYGRGRLVLATGRQLGARLTSLRALLDPRVRHVAIANPSHAPYGRAAREALEAAGVWDAVRAKLVYGDNVRHALQYLQTGAAEAGLVARSVAGAPEIEWVLVDERLHAPLDQVAAVVRRSPRAALGRQLIEFVSGPRGREIMKRYGFVLPGEF